MKQRYFCSHTRRRQAVLTKSALNGLDWIEVDSVHQNRLRIGFLKPPPGARGGIPQRSSLSPQHFRISGGERIPSVKVKSIHVENGDELVLILEGSGDFSMYALDLIDPGNPRQPPRGFDPVLARIYFSFKVSCPTPFDCKPDNQCPPDPASPFIIDRMARDFDSIRQALIDRWQSIDPAFSDPPTADSRAVLLDLFAATGDYLSHYQDAATTESTLSTARFRHSVRRHARLLDYPVHEGLNARAFVWFAVEPGSDADGHLLNSGMELLTGFGTETRIAPETRDEQIRTGSQVFSTRQAVRLYAAHNEIEFHTFHESTCCLRKGSTEAVILSKPGLQLEPGMFVLLQETRNPISGLEAEADLGKRHVVRLNEVRPETDIIENRKLLRLRWADQDALPFTLDLIAKVPDPARPAERLPAAILKGNLIPADHGRYFSGLPLESDERPRLIDGRYVLPGTNLTFESPFDPHVPASAFLNARPQDASPSVVLYDGTDFWYPRSDLLSSLHHQKHFVVEMQENRQATVRFGNDTFGRTPANPAAMRVSLRLGNGPVGNVGHSTIRQIVGGPEGILSLSNPLPARGGTSAESLEQIRHFAPEAFQRQERAVTMEDYREMARRHPGVQDARAELRWTGSHHTVFIAIDRFGGFPVDAAFKKDFRAHIERFRIAGLDLSIREPERVPLEIALDICVNVKTQRAHVHAALKRVFSSGLTAEGTPGFFHPDRFTFGQPLFLSALIESAMRVPGVVRVIPQTFKRLLHPPGDEVAEGLIQPANHQILQMRNDRNYPEKGTLTLHLSGGI